MKLPLHDKKFLFLLLAVAIVVLLEVMSLSGLPIPMPYSPFVLGSFILLFGYQVLWSGLKALFSLNFSKISLLMLIAVCGAFYLGEYPEAAVVIVLYVLGERLEDIGIETSKNALENLVSQSPKTAVVLATKRSTPIEEILIGTVVEVRPGDTIPLDGMVVRGESRVDEAAITGEPIPKEKQEGDAVFAGTANKNGYLEVKTTKEAGDTTFARIIRLTQEAQQNKAKTQQFIQKFSKIYTPSIILLSIGLFMVPVFFLGLELDKWLKQAISLLVIACPCALVISTPVAIYAALGNASSRGVLIKGGKYLELLSKIKAIALDKTRTLTLGKPVVSDVVTLDGSSKGELLACMAGAELFSEHPLAEAIVEASNLEGNKPHAVDQFKSVAGKGASANCLVCKDVSILLGNLNFIREQQPVSKEVEDLVDKFSSEGKTSVVVSFGKGVAGIVALTDEIKGESKDVISELKKLDVESVMLTGDSNKAAAYVASKLGIKNVIGELLPEGKSEEIKKLVKKYNTVAMVGDGINDAPALAESSVGIAMGAVGSDTAIETASVALMNDQLELIPYLVRLSKETLRCIRMNTIGAILVKVLFVVIAFLGYADLVLAIAADVGVTLIVVLLSLNLMSFENKSNK